MSRKPAIHRRDAAFGLFVTLASPGVFAQQATSPRRYATMSLIGDALTAVERQEKTGSRLDKNLQNEIKVGSDVLDRAALGVVNDLIIKADPAAKPLSLLVDEPVLYEKQTQLFDGKFVRLPATLAKAAKDGGATHLLLLTKQRSNLSFKLLDGRVGQGSASGLGFYLEPTLRMRDVDASREADGFLGLYVHIRVTVVDLATEAIVGDQPIVLTDTYVNTGLGKSQGTLPWDSLPARDKIKVISDLMMRAVRDNVPAMLKAS
jgi:hypothetical protein